MVRRYGGAVVFGIICAAFGAVVQRSYDSRHFNATPAAAISQVAGSAVHEAPAQPTPTSTPAIAFDREPLWAYGFDAPPRPNEQASPQSAPSRNLRANQDPEEQTRSRTLAGSTATYSLVDIRDSHNVIDWFPGDHPKMPAIVRNGPAGLGPAAWGCGSCHLPNGKGRPENAPVAGLPAAYFIRQIEDFRHGLRHSADPRKPNTNTMIGLARSLSDEELRAAAQYFSAMTWTPWVRVVESAVAPTTRIAGNLFLPAGEGRTEPIAGRIIEMPADVEQAETLRNPRSGFIAYVPTGSLARGEALVTTGGMTIVDNRIVQGKTTACGACHGPDLAGVADVPGIAGRSPSYLVRQIWDMQQGTRNGAAAQVMKLAVANLTKDDMVAIAAYVASRPVPAPVGRAGQVASTR